jgi:hypothetical protein
MMDSLALSALPVNLLKAQEKGPPVMKTFPQPLSSGVNDGTGMQVKC